MFSSWRVSLVVVAIAATVFLTGLGAARLWDEDEPKNSVCGQEMFARGDWIVPTFNGDLRTDKPILLYWCMLAVYHMIGMSEFADRLPSALAGIGTVLLTFHLGRLMFNARSGFIAACLLASGLMFSVLARGATPDSLLIFCITASITSFVAGVAAQRGGNFNGNVGGFARAVQPVMESGLPTGGWLGMYVAMGFAVLAKGPIGVVMPVGIIGCYLLFFDGVVEAPVDAGWPRRFMQYFSPYRILRVIRTLRLVWGLPIAAAISLPWYIAVGIQTHGEWLVGFLGKHNIGRFTQPMEHHNGLPIYYLVAIAAGFFPGSAFLPVGIWKAVASIRNRDSERPASALLMCWICCYVGFFTLAATKLPNYVVPCYPALAVVVGSWFSTAIERATARDWRLRAGYWTIALVGIAATITLVVLAKMLLGTDVWPALPGLVAVIGGAICLVVLRRGNVRGSIFACVAVGLVFTTTAMTFTAYRASQLEEGPQIAEQVDDLVATSHGVPRVATFNYFTPSLVYYLGHPVERLDKPEDIAKFFAEGGDAIVASRTAFEKQRKHIPNDVTILAEHKRFLRKNERVVLLGRPTEIAKLNGQLQAR